MANQKISDLASAGALSGTELIETVQGGVNKKTTTQDIANLAGGGGTWGSITGTLSDQTDLQAAFDLKSDNLVTTVSKTASHTLDSTDLGNVNDGKQLMFSMDVASANDFTIPLNATQAFPVGTVIGIRQDGAGQTTIVPTGGVTLHAPLNAYKLASQNALAFLEKTGTNTWHLNGETVI